MQKRLPRPQRRLLLSAVFSALALPRSAWPAAQPFPQRPVRLVVPYSVGVGPDIVARSLAGHLQRAWQQTVWVDNKPGASGIVAFSEVRHTPADGHTLFLADTATLAVNPLLHSQLPYDPVQDLLPLSLLFRATFLIWVGGGSRLDTLAALLAAARQAPGRVSYASLGHGHASQVAIETFARAAGLQLLHVPFKDAGNLVSAVVSGDVDFTAIGLNSVAGLAAQGKLRPLAVAARQRLAQLPSLPTLPEAGGPAVEMHPWAALVGVAGTPPAVLAQLLQAIAQALAAPEVRQQAEQAGFELTPSTPQALLDRVQADIAQVQPLVDEGRIARL